MEKRNQIAVKYEERGLTPLINYGDISLMCNRSTVTSTLTPELDDMLKFNILFTKHHWIRWLIMEFYTPKYIHFILVCVCVCVCGGGGGGGGGG